MADIPRHILSKSTFMYGCQCPKRLWLYKKKPELRDDLSASQEMVFERGTNVGLLARQLFPAGKDATPVDTFHYQDAVLQTREWIAAGENVIYEAAFQYDGVLCAIDILVKERGKWKTYEVKSSTEVKDQYITDAALQYYVLTNSGLKLADISIIHINNTYVRRGELDLRQLFTIQSVRDEVKAEQDFIEEKIPELKAVMAQRKEPDTDIGPHCNAPYACDLMGYCWSHIPEVSVFNLTHMRGTKKFELYYQGIVGFEQLPDGFKLSSVQQLQVKAHLEDYTHIEPLPIRAWLGELENPLCFMDFETFQPAVPLYEGCRPYQFVPFQFSVHRQGKPKGKLQHFEYLGSPEADPRPDFIRQLIEATRGAGTVLVYNKGFEATRLKELQLSFPKQAKALGGILERIADLMEPFQQRWYYTPSMNGSHSIKTVLPALVPELSYEALEIGEGGTAMAAFEGLLNINDENERRRIRKALLEYCKLDTLAMVRVLEKLGRFEREY